MELTIMRIEKCIYNNLFGWYKTEAQDLARLLPNGRSVAWGAFFARAGDQISEQVARMSALLDSSSLSCKYDPSWN